MKGKFVNYLVILVLILSTGSGVSFAQEILFTPREDMMFFTLDRMQAGYDKKEATREAVIETQMRLTEAGLSKKASRGEEGILKSLKKRTHPYFSTGIGYNSNVDDAVGGKGDIYYSFSPGVKINFAGKNKALNLNFSLFDTIYNKRRDKSDIDAIAGFSSYINIGKYILSMNESYNNNYIGGAKELGIEKEIQERGGDVFERRWSNTNSTTLSRYFNRIGFDIGYTRTDLDYEPKYSVDNDLFTDTGRFNTYLRIATKTRLLLGYKHDRTVYRKNTEIDNSDDYNIAVTGALSPKVTYLVRADYFEKDCKPNIINDGERTLVYTANFGYTFTNRTNMSFNYNYGFIRKQPGDDPDDVVPKNAFTFTANHRMAFNPKFNLSLNYYSEFSEDQTLGFGLSYAFRQWIDFSLGWASQLNREYDQYTLDFKTNARF